MDLNETQKLALSYASRVLSATTGATEASCADQIRRDPSLLRVAFESLEDLEQALTPAVQPKPEPVK